MYSSKRNNLLIRVVGTSTNNAWTRWARLIFWRTVWVYRCAMPPPQLLYLHRKILPESVYALKFILVRHKFYTYAGLGDLYAAFFENLLYGRYRAARPYHLCLHLQ